MKQNQKSHKTKYNRYPKIFREIKREIPMPNNILSFGCSTGEECNSLNNIYFPNTNIIGFDISEEVINSNRKNNINDYISYEFDISKINVRFDLVLAMSVLCVWPENRGRYDFKTFKETLDKIDNLIKVGGYLCIYNSKYLFSDTLLFKNKYSIISTNYTESGFVTKYTKTNVKLNNPYPYFLYQKEQ